MKFRGFLGSFHQAQARRASWERLVNMYVEHIAPENPHAPVDARLVSCPGLEAFATPPAGAGRGIFAENDRTFAVVGDQLVEVFSNGSYVTRPLTSIADFAAAPTITPAPPTPALAQPNPPRVQQGGSVGTTTYGYKIVAKNAIGQSVASLEGLINTGAAALDANNFNYIDWDEVPNATGGYDVYRTTGGAAPPKRIGSTLQTVRFFQDTGQAGVAATPPAVDTSAGSVGSTVWGYKVAAIIGLATTAASAEGTTTTGQAVLDASNYNDITWAPVTNAQGYMVWVTSGPGITTPMLLTTINDGTTVTFRHTGQTGEANTPPAANTSTTQTLVNDGSMVSIASSGDAGQQLLIAATGKAYCYDLRTNVFAMVLEGATFIDYLQGYFLALDANESKLKHSSVLNGFVWSDIDFQQRTTGTDKWVSMKVFNKEIWLVGTQTTEVWVHTGAPEPALPFSPIASVFIQAGTIAAFSLSVVGNALMCYGQHKQGGSGVLISDGSYAFARASTQVLEQTIAKYAVKADAEAWSYEDGGHLFYVLSFPTVGRTWVYDLTTKEWHERGFSAANARDWSVYRPRAYAWAFSGITEGYHLVVDREDGTVYRLRSDRATDADDRPIIRLREAPHITSNQRDITHDELELVFEPGQGAVTGAGADPQVMLQWSDDAGFTWSNEYWVGAGKIGEYFRRARWQQLGSSRARIYRMMFSAPIPLSVVDALLELRSSRH